MKFSKLFWVTLFSMYMIFFSANANATEPLWAPADRIGPTVLDLRKERWEGFENYDGYFWTFHAFKWNKSVLDKIASDPMTTAGMLDEGVYEFRRGPDEGGAWEHWDGVWARMQLDWAYIILPQYNLHVYTEYLSSLPDAGNSGTEETDDWFADRTYVGWDITTFHIWFGIKPYFPISWAFDLCGITEPRANQGKCDEEYEIGFDWTKLEPDKYYYNAIKFRTDASEEKEKIDWFVKFEFEQKGPLPGIYYNHYSCQTDYGTWSFEYDPNPIFHNFSQTKKWGCVDGNEDGIADGEQDSDKDGIIDFLDDCPNDPDNDADGDGLCGDVDPFPFDVGNDTDGDGIAGNRDNCPSIANPAQEDLDKDNKGNACDPDMDGDGVPNEQDILPLDPLDWLDNDHDGIGDNMDADDDNDGYRDILELSLGTDPFNSISKPADNDADLIPDTLDLDDDNDGVPDNRDAFPLNSKEQFDTDGDGIGNNADTDDDNDGVSDSVEIQYGSNPLNPFSRPADFDNDGLPDSVDTDDDNDGIPDELDPFPRNANELSDNDKDGIGDSKDKDDDNDMYPDELEKQLGTDPMSASSKPADWDGDLIPDVLDPDDDNDGVPDELDAFPFDAVESVDTDGDGIGDNADSDDDNDCYLDIVESSEGTNSKDINSTPADFDKDCLPDSMDPDDDNDGVPDELDLFPFNPAEWADNDRDGIGDNADTDDDNDCYPDVIEQNLGSDPLNPSSTPADNDKDCNPDVLDPDDDNDACIDTNDAFPFDLTECLDTDGDGIGNNKDDDDDGDCYLDSVDNAPLDAGTHPLDNDNDCNPDSIDPNDDNDVAPDVTDAFPFDPKEWLDNDNDGMGDNADTDDDNDGMPDDWEIKTGTKVLEADADEDPDNDHYSNMKEYLNNTFPNNSCSPPHVEFCYQFFTDEGNLDENGQCGANDPRPPFGIGSNGYNNGGRLGDGTDKDGAVGTFCVPMEEWTPAMFIDTDDKQTGCQQRFSIRSSCNLNLNLSMYFGGVDDQCRNKGLYTVDINEWTPAIGLDMGSAGGGCDQNFMISGDPGYKLTMSFKATDDAGQCGNPGVYDSESELANWMPQISPDTDNRNGGCLQKFLLTSDIANKPNPWGYDDYYGFCGSSSLAGCSADSECKEFGERVCGGVSETIATSSDIKDCYNADRYGLNCGCLNGRCVWHAE